MQRPAVLIGSLALAVVAPMAAAGATASSPPYQDPNASGGIGLCDKSGHEITHGSISARPFAWRAVSTAPARAPYDATGRTATLYAYQPRQGVAAGDWSGDQLTATSRYTNPSHPMAQATAGDESLKEYMAEFAPSWDGLLQLRMFLGAPGQTTQSFSYPAATIKVTGRTWRVLSPVTVSCTSGSATSIESILLPTSAKANRHGGSHPAASSGHHGGTTGAANGSAGSSTGAAVASPATTDVAASRSTDGGSARSTARDILLGVLVLLIAAWYVVRRRRSGSTQ